MLTRDLGLLKHLEPVNKEAIAEQLLPQTLADHTEFHRCFGCEQIFWPGSHFANMQRFVDQVRYAR